MKKLGLGKLKALKNCEYSSMLKVWACPKKNNPPRLEVIVEVGIVIWTHGLGEWAPSPEPGTNNKHE